MKIAPSILKTMLATTGGIAISTAVIGIANGVTTSQTSQPGSEYSAAAKKAKAVSKPTATPAPPRMPEPCPACGMG